jgi:malate synthase
VVVGARRLLTIDHARDGITHLGLRTNISVSVRYLAAWLSGTGAVAIDGLNEDSATAEISRAQVWQWAHHRMILAGPEKTRVTNDLVRAYLDETIEKLTFEGVYDAHLLSQARCVFEQVALADDFPLFVTLVAYDQLP